MLSNRSVAEVQAKQVHVIGSELIEIMLVTTALLAGIAVVVSPPVGMGEAPGDPFADGGTSDPDPS
jgi:hypothetical protein